MDRKLTLVLALSFVMNGIADEHSVIEETIITANARANDLSANEIGSSEFGSYASEHSFSDISAVNQSLYMNDNGRRSEITVRGLGSTGGVFNPGIEPSVSVFLDGVYLPVASLVAGSINDIATVNVSTGQKDKTSGNTSAIGNIRIETVKPSLNKQSVYVDLKAGKEKNQLFGLGGNWHVGKNAAFNVYLYDRNSDGFYQNIANGDEINNIDRKGGVLKYLYQLDDTMSILTSVLVVSDNSDWIGSGRALSSRYTDEQARFFNTLVPLAYAANGELYPGADEIYLPQDLRYTTVANDVESDSDVNKALASITIRKQWGDTTFRSISAYINHDQSFFVDSDNTNFNLANQQLDDNTDVYSQEFKLEHRNEKSTLLYGLYFYASEKYFGTTGFAGPDLLYLRTLIAENDDQKAYFRRLAQTALISGKSAPVYSASKGSEREGTFYLQYEHHYSDESFYRMGFDATYVNKQFERSQDGFCSYDTVNLPKDECTATKTLIFDKYYYDGDTRLSDQFVTAFALRQWRLGQGLNVLVSGGFHKKPGGYNYMQSVGVGPSYVDTIEELEFAPEQTYSLDATLGYQFNDDRSQGDITLYSTKIRDYQLSYFDGTQFFTTNAERVMSQGIELEVSHRVSEHWQWDTSFNYNKAFYVTNKNGVCPPEEYRNKKNCSYSTNAQASADGARVYGDLSGEDIRNSPRVKIHTVLSFQKEVKEGLNIKTSADYSLLGKTRTTEFVHDGFERSRVNLFNFYINVLMSDVDIAFMVKNITDEKVRSTEFASPIVRTISGLPGGINTFLEPRRSWEFSMRYRL